jgi:multidrug resistance efflux pump
MIRRLTIPAIAGAMLLFAIYHVVTAQQASPNLPPPVEPARSPFGSTLAASGVVEAETENIAVGSHLPGVVVEVAVKVGQAVPAGAPLFRLDDRQLQSELALREANLEAARAQLAKLEAQPRAEELPAAEARVREAQATFESWSDQYERARRLSANGAIGDEEVVKLRQSRQAAQEQRDRARAELALLMAGAWAPDKAVARAGVAQMQAQLDMTRTEIDRLCVRAPIAGEVLQVNVRPGEFVGAPPGQALAVLGTTDRLHVRVDVDENDIHRFRADAPATARLRGDPRQEFPLRFVRIEPYVIPKKSLTGANTERIDTRVLQVIFAVEPGAPRLFVGQQVDTFVDVGK